MDGRVLILALNQCFYIYVKIFLKEGVIFEETFGRGNALKKKKKKTFRE